MRSDFGRIAFDKAIDERDTLNYNIVVYKHASYHFSFYDPAIKHASNNK